MLRFRFVVGFLLVACAVACGNGDSATPVSPSPTPSPGGPSSSVVIPVGAESLGNRAYMPADLNIAAGTTVTWTNSDRETHTSTSNAPSWNSGNIGPGGRFAFTFQTTGSFQYHCTIHPEMVGTITVR